MKENNDLLAMSIFGLVFCILVGWGLYGNVIGAIIGLIVGLIIYSFYYTTSVDDRKLKNG